MPEGPGWWSVEKPIERRAVRLVEGVAERLAENSVGRLIAPLLAVVGTTAQIWAFAEGS